MRLFRYRMLLVNSQVLEGFVTAQRSDIGWTIALEHTGVDERSVLEGSVREVRP